MARILTNIPVDDWLTYNPDTGITTLKVRFSSDFSRPDDYTRWRKRVNKPITTMTSDGYMCVMLNGKSYLLHRLIWFLVYKEEPNIIDHINRNRSDNRLVNLRSVTCIENLHNRALGAGISYNNAYNKYTVQISLNYKRVFLGRFVNYEDALQARKIAEIKYWRK